MNGFELLIDPQQLLVVAFLDDDGSMRTLLAITCRYLPVMSSTGIPSVGIEVVSDPTHPNPVEPYYCTPQNLHRTLIAPVRVRSIRPYHQQG